MKVEHIGISVPDPIGMGQWYVDHLGFRLLRSGVGPDNGVAFVMDRPDGTTLELFKLSGVAPMDSRALQPMQLHIAIQCDDPGAEADRLALVGATIVREPGVTVDPRELSFVRDPWGFVLQFINRKNPLPVR